jgi:hypothetical protein
MKTRSRRTQQRWTRKVSVTPRISKSLSAPRPEVREPARESGSSVHLGPYESSYDVTLGYSFDRAIVTP